MNDIIESIIIKLLETRGNLSFDKSKIDNRRETLPIKRKDLKNRLNLKFKGKKTAQDNETLDAIAASTRGVTINGAPFVAIDDNDFKKKRKKNEQPDLQTIYATGEHENVHSMFNRLLAKKNIPFDKIQVFVDEFIRSANLSKQEKSTFDIFKSALKRWGRFLTLDKTGESVVSKDEPIAYLLDYLNNKKFRHDIKVALYDELKKNGTIKATMPLDEIQAQLRKIDVDLKRIWSKIRIAAKEF